MLCFYRHPSFCSQGRGHISQYALSRHPLIEQTPPLVRHTPLVRHPLGRHPLPSACWDTPLHPLPHHPQTVRILLECILVC